MHYATLNIDTLHFFCAYIHFGIIHFCLPDKYQHFICHMMWKKTNNIQRIRIKKRKEVTNFRVHRMETFSIIHFKCHKDESYLCVRRQNII